MIHNKDTFAPILQKYKPYSTTLIEDSGKILQFVKHKRVISEEDILKFLKENFDYPKVEVLSKDIFSYWSNIRVLR